MTADPIPAIREEEAVGDTAEIFADLRATLGLPFVNLIWRHLATVPGALQAVWPAVRPLYLTAELAARSAGIGAGARPGGVEPVPREAWSALGVDEVARRDVAGLVDAYNRANSTNFLVFTTIDVLVRGGRGPGGRARTGNGDTLYRHLALWPPFLATAYVALSPLHRSGALQAAQRDLIEVARSAVVDELVPLLPQARLAVDDDVRARIGPVVEEFATIIIGRMVVAGAVMRALLPDPDDHAAG